MGYANELYRTINDDMTTLYTFRFGIPILDTSELTGKKAFDMTVSNILSYLEMHINQTDLDLVSSEQRLNKYVGIVIENAIYDIFTKLEGDPQGIVGFDDMDEWILSHHDFFRDSLYTFTVTVIKYCISELKKIRESFKEMGAYVTPFQFYRNPIDPGLLEVRCYLEKTRKIPH